LWREVPLWIVVADCFLPGRLASVTALQLLRLNGTERTIAGLSAALQQIILHCNDITV